MATRKKRPAARSTRSSSGNGMTFSSVLLGLIIGLSVAAVAAFMIMRSPSPIQDHRQPANGQPGALTGQAAPSQGKTLIDPNAWMNSDGSINSAQQPPTRQKIEPLPPLLGIPENAGDMPFTAGGTLPPATQPTTPPGKTAPKADDDQIASLINTLPGEKTPATRAPATTQAASRNEPTTASQSAAPKTAAAPTAPAAQSRSGAPRYLQVGSYRDEKEADAFRARMIMMGFNVQIQKARVNNMDVNRVRIGPFDSDKELSESRAQLSGAKINSTIVR